MSNKKPYVQKKKDFTPTMEKWPGTDNYVIKVPFEYSWGIEGNGVVLLYIDEAKAILKNLTLIKQFINRADQEVFE